MQKHQVQIYSEIILPEKEKEITLVLLAKESDCLPKSKEKQVEQNSRAENEKLWMCTTFFLKPL